MSRRIDYEKERKRNQIVGQGSEISHPDNYSFDMKTNLRTGSDETVKREGCGVRISGCLTIKEKERRKRDKQLAHAIEESYRRLRNRKAIAVRNIPDLQKEVNERADKVSALEGEYRAYRNAKKKLRSAKKRLDKAMRYKAELSSEIDAKPDERPAYNERD